MFIYVPRAIPFGRRMKINKYVGLCGFGAFTSRSKYEIKKKRNKENNKKNIVFFLL